MKPKWHNKNFGKSSQDPDYLEDYDAEQDLESYIYWQELKEQLKRENNEN